MRDNLHVRTTAQHYDDYAATSVEPWDALLIGRVLEESRSRPPGGRLLDIGTGTAIVLAKLAALVPLRDVELIGSDYFEDMVAEARKRVEGAGLSGRIRIDREDVHALSYPDGFARYVISKSTIHHWSRPVEALKEIHRVLEPGGVALIHEIRRDANPEVVRTFNGLRKAAGVGPANLDEKYTPAEVQQMCEQAGIAASALISAPESGPGSIGFELRITR